MDDATVMSTIKHEGLHCFDLGDKVEVTNRNYLGLKGVIISLDKDDFVVIKTLDKVPFELKVKQTEIIKFFEVGESVRVISGTHSGESGIIT